MKYLKRFEKENEYLSYVESDSFLLPNVSLIDEFSGSSGEGAKFNPLPESNDDPYNGYEYVDLGLPSGTLWAKCNVGGNSESDYGLYFAWGEVEGYNSSQVGYEANQRPFDGSDYKWGKGNSITKYKPGLDNLTTLLPEDDAASVNMGGSWHMPSKEQFEELYNSSYTTTTWTMVNSIEGILITSKTNNNTLFLPTSGFCCWGFVNVVGSYGYCWSSSLDEDPEFAWSLEFSSDNADVTSDSLRHYGHTVRGVIG